MITGPLASGSGLVDISQNWTIFAEVVLLVGTMEFSKDFYCRQRENLVGFVVIT
jgi:hypothetical protein